MKTFSRLPYDGPDGVTLKKILVEDGADIEEGDPLFEFER